MAEIVLTAINAKYIHSALGLRYLLANLGDLKDRARILEFDPGSRPPEIAEAILRENPKIVGVSMYVWNAGESRALVSILKRVQPELTVVLGGPEVSYEWEDQEIVRLADYLIAGEADLAFADLCRRLLNGEPPQNKLILAPLPDLKTLTLPYSLYDDDDIAHRTVYVETSRGCPFECEFCLSSLDIPVRRFPLRPLLREFERLLDRGVKHFKFVDRTFNVHIATGLKILEFFLERHRPGLFLHFEMVPDRLPAELRDLISRFPAGALQFEIGVQTFNPDVGDRIHRRQNIEETVKNLRFLRGQTSVHIHADLILGLPGESFASFAAGFDRLTALRPQEIQVGILKRLRGAPIARHTAEWEMVYNTDPPYELLRNKLIDFQTMQRLKRFSRYWDLVSNSGRFPETAPLIWKDRDSAFWAFLDFSDWLYSKLRRHHSIALHRLTELLFRYLTEVRHQSPELLKPYFKDRPPSADSFAPSVLQRQRRHAAARNVME